MAGNPKPKDEEDWQELIQQFKRLQLRIKPSAYADIFQEIVNTIKSLQANKPKPKVYRATKKRLEKLELFFNNSDQHSR